MASSRSIRMIAHNCYGRTLFMYEAFMTESIRMDARVICKLEIVGHRRPAEDARAESEPAGSSNLPEARARAERRAQSRSRDQRSLILRGLRSAKGLPSAGLRSNHYRRLDGAALRIVARGDEAPDSRLTGVSFRLGVIQASRLARTLQSAADRDSRAAEQRRGFSGSPTEYIAQQDCGALARRQLLDGGDKSTATDLPRHRLAPRVP